jgi:hypothetical protein
MSLSLEWVEDDLLSCVEWREVADEMEKDLVRS